jgi:hypothetical protein
LSLGEKFTGKIPLAPCLYTKLGGETVACYAPKLLLKQKAAGLLVFCAALFILKEELNSHKE